MRHAAAIFIGLIAVLFGCLNGCKPAASSTEPEPTLAPGKRIDLLFTYGSEKEDWVKAVTPDFNRLRVTTPAGKTIQVNAVPMGSGECIDTILNGRIQAHLTSPASAAFIKLGNAQSRVKTGKDLIGPTENLVLSPVIIAMWKPMADALGWRQKPIGWAEILAIAQDPGGWASLGHPEWGPFRFGHTSPLHSNSGLISLFAEVYAATGKAAGLTIADVTAPATASYLAAIESASPSVCWRSCRTRDCDGRRRGAEQSGFGDPEKYHLRASQRVAGRI
jgi:Ca-activated chloride channel homolog